MKSISGRGHANTQGLIGTLTQNDLTGIPVVTIY